MIKKSILKFMSIFCTAQFVKFLIVGGTATLANFLFGLYLRHNFSSSLHYYEMSIISGYTVGTVISFVLNKFFTFKANNESTLIQLLKFLVPAIISYFLALLVALTVKKICHQFDTAIISSKMIDNIAHMTAIGVTTIFNFLSMKYFSFKKLNINKVHPHQSSM